MLVKFASDALHSSTGWQAEFSAGKLYFIPFNLPFNNLLNILLKLLYNRYTYNKIHKLYFLLAYILRLL